MHNKACIFQAMSPSLLACRPDDYKMPGPDGLPRSAISDNIAGLGSDSIRAIHELVRALLTVSGGFLEDFAVFVEWYGPICHCPVPC